MDKHQRKSTTCTSSYKWGVFIMGGIYQWLPVGFFLTKRAAHRYAYDNGYRVCMVARRTTRDELRDRNR